MTQKQTVPVFLHAQESVFNPGTYSFTAFGCDMASCGYIPLGCTDLEFDVPSDEQIVARHAVLLKEKIKEVRATAEKQVIELREQLSKLESLTYSPQPEPDDVP